MQKVVVITGSTRGIGFGMAEEFLLRGCRVVVSGRSQASVDQALQLLQSRHPDAQILGQPCDVQDPVQIEALWAAAHAAFGQVDIWVNNAGVSNKMVSTWEQTPEEIARVIDTNVRGVMYGCRTALRGMLAQGFGALYNMEGLGSDGRRVPGLNLYGTTKYAVRYFTEGLIEETRGTPVLVGELSPGMVATDMLTGEAARRRPDWDRQKSILNILTDKVETVTPWLVEQMLDNQQHGARIAWLTRGKILRRFLSAPFHRRRVID